MKRTFPVHRRLLGVIVIGCFAVSGPVGCSDAQAGSLLGAGLGALAGQAIGRDTEGTVLGTAIGAGAGYIIGNESDKAKLRRRSYSGRYDYDY